MEKIQVKSLIILFINVVLMSYLYSCSTSIKTSKYEGPKTQDSVDNTEVKNYLSEITDIPLPNKSEIDLEKTVVVGKQGNWMGRLTLINKNPIDEIFSFFVNEMPKFDFKEKSLIRSAESTLIFQNNKKTIFIKISKLNFRKNYIEITSTPIN